RLRRSHHCASSVCHEWLRDVKRTPDAALSSYAVFYLDRRAHSKKKIQFLPPEKSLTGTCTPPLSPPTTSCPHDQGGALGRLKIHFACPEQGDGLDSVKMFALGNPKPGEVRLTELFPEHIRCDGLVRIQDDEALTFLLVWDSSDHTGRITKKLVERF